MPDTPKPIKIPAVRCPDCKLPYRGGTGEGSFAEHDCPGKDSAAPPKKVSVKASVRGRGKKS